MGNPEHVEKLKEGVEAWNRWREAHQDVIPDLADEELSWNFVETQPEEVDFRAARLKGATFSMAHLEGAHFERADLEGAHFVGAHLKGAHLVAAELEGADFRLAHLEGAHFEGAELKGANFVAAELKGARFVGAHLEGADFGAANLEGANLRDAKGVRFDETKILHARLTPQPGAFWQRLLPWFILNPLTDPWSTLRRAYTGANFIITLLALVAFLLPYAFQATAWRSVNAAQTLMRDTVSTLATQYEGLEALAGIEPCFASACESYFVWQLLLAGDRGWLTVALALAVILYNVVRFYLTQTVMAYREEEERSGFTPKWAEQIGADRGPAHLRVLRGALGGYQHLVWLHIFLRWLLLVVLVSFATNLGRVLLLRVELPAA